MESRINVDMYYMQSLEERLIEYLAKCLDVDWRKSMDIYYKSRLCRQIENKEYGIENMDFKYLAEDLIENERDLIDRELAG